MRFKKTLAFVLAITMVISTFPVFSLPVSAAGGTDSDISDMNALDAIGIDTTEVPEGIDLDSTENPYGRDTALVSPVFELFVQGKLANNANLNMLYGHNKQLTKTWDYFYASQGDAKTNVNVIGYAATATASGNFIKDPSGATGQTVTVGVRSLDKKGGLDIYFSDPVNDQKGSPKVLLDTTKTIGNTGNQMNENFAADPYLMQNYLKITAGDYDGDGIDEVAVYVAEQGGSRVEIYDLQVGTGFTNFRNTAHWAKAWTYYFNENPYVSNMVSLTSGDMNQDGIDDLALTWGFYYGPSKFTNSKAAILIGAKENMLQKVKSIPLSHEGSPIVRAAFTKGDIDSDNVDDLILGGQLNSDIAVGNLNSRFVAVYNYNGNEDIFLQSIAKNFDLFATKENDAGETVYKNPAMATHNDTFYSLPTMVANISAINMLGVGQPSNIYFDSLIIEYGDEGLNITVALDQNAKFNKNISTDYPSWLRNIDGQFYNEYSAIAADFTGDTTQTLQVMLHYVAENYEIKSSYSVPSYRDWWDRLFGILQWTVVNQTDTFAVPEETVMVALKGNITEKADQSGYDFDVLTKKTNVVFATSFTKLNSDNDTGYIRYTNKHGVIYSDPKVLAVLASAPHFDDLGRDDLSGTYMESATGYSSTKGSGSESTTSNTLSVGGYVSYSSDIEVFSVKVAGWETELAYTHGWTWETTQSSMMEMTVSYETGVGQDSVVFYSIPMEYYIYDSYVPEFDSNGTVTGYNVQQISVNLPHTAAVVVLALDKYEKIAADYAELPKISGTVLTHEIGKPSSYPSSSAGYNNVIEYNGDWAGVDYSAVGASVTQEINVTKENGTGMTNTNTIDFKIGAGPGDFIFGVSLGYEHGSSKVTITSEGSTYSGTINNMPIEAEEFGYYYAWKLFTYTSAINGNTFPVVNYMVKDVTSPPTLPKDFDQSSDLTTDEAIGLTWSYPSDSAVAGFQIYRYYEFPEGSGSYELAFIPASQVSYISIENGKRIRHYQFVDVGLADYTDYDYQIQTVRGAVPPASIVSGVLTARTKSDKGYPTTSLLGVDTRSTDTFDEEGNLLGTVEDYSMLVYPDSTKTVSVNILESYDQAPKYQWQKLTDNVWEDMVGANKQSYTFKNSGVSSEGEYRARVNVIYEDDSVGQIYYITAFTDTFTLNYSLRQAEVASNGFTVNLANETVSLVLKSSHTNHTFAPSGNVIFNVRGADYKASYKVRLGSPSPNYETTATLELGNVDQNGDDIFANLPDGVYEITAYYSGSRVFAPLTPSTSTYYVAGSGSGYLLNVDQSFTYGDDVPSRLMSISENNGQVDVSESTVGVTYKMFKEVGNLRISSFTISTIFGNWTFSYPVIFYEYVERTGFVKADNSISAIEVGKYQLRAYVGGQQVATRDLVINQKAITIGLNNTLTGVAGNAAITHPSNSELNVITPNGLVGTYGDTISSLGLVVKAFNTAGTQVTISPSTDPGNYTLEGSAANNQTTDQSRRYNNYKIVYEQGLYTLTGPRYDMTLRSDRFGNDNDIVGRVEIINPEVKDMTGLIVNAATTATNSAWYLSDAFTGGTTLTLRATPQVGYQVKSWTVVSGGVTVVYGPSKTFVYQTTADDTVISTQFELAKNKLFFKSSDNTATMGTVETVGSAILSGAVVQEGATYTFVARPKEGYHFVKWNVSGSVNSEFLGDVDPLTGASTTSLTMGNVDTILTAVFIRNDYTLDLQVGLEANYPVDDGFGTLVNTTSTGIVTIPGDTLVTVTPATGFTILSDAAWMVNNQIVTVLNETYTFNMMEDMAITVGTSQDSYDVSVAIRQPTSTSNNQVTVKINHTPTDFSVMRQVSGGLSLEFKAVPAWGYVFDHWIVNGAVSLETSRVVTLPELGEDTVVEAVFVINPNSHTVQLGLNSGGDLAYTVVYTENGYSANAPMNVPLTSGSTQIMLYEGDTLIVNAMTDPNYMLRSWTVGDQVDELPTNQLTLSQISSDLTVSARFIPMSFTTINYNADTGGVISSATSNGIVFASGDVIGNGTRLVVTALPDVGKMVDHWTVDGKTFMTSDSTTYINESLVIESLSASDVMTIVVHFTNVDEHTIKYDLTNASVTRFYTPTSYTNQSANTPTMNYVANGTKAVLVAVPEVGYRITSYTVNGNTGTENDDGTWTFTVNSVEENLNVLVIGEKLYSVIVDSGITNGSISIATEKEALQAIAGESITLTDITPFLDYTFDEWSYNSNPVVGTSFIMPAADVIVSANFRAIDTTEVNYKVFDANGSDPNGYNGTISAVLNRQNPDFTSVSGYPVADSDGLIIANRGYTDAYASWPNTVIELKAMADPGYRAKYWYINGVAYSGPTSNYKVIGNTMLLTVNQGSEDLYDIQVQFDLIGEKITYESVNTFGSITSVVLTNAFDEATNINSGDILTVDGTISFEVNVEVGYQVEGWYVNGVKQVGEVGTTYDYMATAGLGAHIIVNIERVSYVLTYGGVNGAVSGVSGGLLIGASPTAIVGDSVVTLTAIANPGYAFDHWTVDGQVNGELSNSLTLTIIADTTVTAHFIEFANLPITYQVNGGNGTLTAVRSGIDFASGDLAAANDLIGFTATPNSVASGDANNYRVSSWMIGATLITTNSPTYSLRVTDTTDITVVFERYDFVIDYGVAVSGNGVITTTSDPSGNGSYRVLVGESTTFTAVPADGYQVKSWTVSGSTTATEDTTLTLNNITQDVTVIVEFEAIPSYTITVVTSGTGYGSVSASVDNQASVAKVTSVVVSRHGTVKLTAIRYDASNAFTGWTIPNPVTAIANPQGILLELKDVTGDIVIDARFGPAKMIEVSASETDPNGTLDYNKVKVGYLNANLTNIIDLSGSSVQVTVGMDLEIKALPANGYMVKEWIVNNVVQSELSNTLILNELNADTNIEVTFEAIKILSIPADGDVANNEYFTVVPGEKIPAEIGNNSEVRERGTITFTLVPEVGYYFSTLMIDGVDLLVNASSVPGTTENIVSSSKESDGSYVVRVANVVTDIQSTIVTVQPMVTVTPPSNGSMVVTYVDGLGAIQTLVTGDVIPVGTQITIKANANSGYYFGNWTGSLTGKSGTQITYLTPRSAVVISGVFNVITFGGGTPVFIPVVEIIEDEIPLSDIISVITDGDPVIVLATITATVDESNGESRIEVTEAVMNRIIEALENSGAYKNGIMLMNKSLFIDLEVVGTGSLESLSVDFTKEAVNLLPNKTKISLKGALGGIVLDVKTLDDLVTQLTSGTITVGLKTTEGNKATYEVTFKEGTSDLLLDSTLFEIYLPYTLKTGEIPEALVPYYLDALGNRHNVTGSYDLQSGLHSLMINQGGTYSFDYNLIAFADVKAGDWYYKAITYLAARGIANGSNGDFNPKDSVSRADFIVLLMRAYELEPLQNSTDNFDDAGNKYYTPYLAAAKKLGITNGIGDNKFDPEAKITREAIAVLLHSTLKMLNRLPEAAGDKSVNDYLDAKDISSWAKSSMEAMVKAGVISGSNDKLMPKDLATRAQTAQILFNLMK